MPLWIHMWCLTWESKPACQQDDVKWTKMIDFGLFQLSSYAQYIYFSETESLNIGERTNICEVEQPATELEGFTVRVSPLPHVSKALLK